MKRQAKSIHELNLNTVLFHQEFQENYRAKYKLNKSCQRNRIHSHNHYEILFSITGDIHFLINENVYPLIGNDLILLNSTDIHGFIFSHDSMLERYVVEFNPAYIRSLCTDFNILSIFDNPGREPILHLTYEQAQVFLSLFNKLKSLDDPSDTYALPLYRKLAFTELLLQTGKFAQESQQTFRISGDPKVERMQKILAYINAHLSEDLTVEHLARTFFISSSYLSSIFKSFTGYTVNQYIISKRILLASNLLKENCSVQYAAEQSGFNNYAHFIRTFKKLTGYPPKQYAKYFSSLLDFKDEPR